MKIALNALSARAGAGISVFQTLMKSISELDNNTEYFVFVSSQQRSIIESIPDSFIKIYFKNCPSNPLLRVLWEQIVLPFYIYKNRINVLYSVGNTTILFAPCKILLFIENTNPLSRVINNWTLKERVRNRLLFYLGWLSSKRANRIRFCSKSSMDIIKRIYKIQDKKCFLLPHGLDFSKIKLVNQRIFEFDYILSVSVVAPHKNFEVLLKAFSILKSKNIYNGKLVLVGNTDCYPNYYKTLLDIVKKNKIDDEVIFNGGAAYSDVFGYYEYADLFVFPSLEETFGIPLIEALSFNLACVVSDGSKYKNLFIPFCEIGMGHVICFDPYSEADLAEKITICLNNKKTTDSYDYVKNNYSINNIAKKLVDEFKIIHKANKP